MNIIVIKKKNINLFLEKIKKFNIKNQNNYAFIGIDYEYTKNKELGTEFNSLHQISLFYNNNVDIFIIEPNLFSKEELNVYIECIYNSKIKKIIHGGHSKDMPYIYNELLKNNNEIFINFINYLFDTEFICNYYNNQNKLTNKCSLNNLLLNMNLMTQQNYDRLGKIKDEIDPIHKGWHVDYLSDAHIFYASSDVIYLKDLLLILKKKIVMKYYTFDHLIECIRYSYYCRYEIFTMFHEMKRNNTQVNNYDIKYKGGTIKLIKYYNIIMKLLHLNSFLEINYFKLYLDNLFKYITYSILLEKQLFYVKNNLTFSINYLKNELKLLNLHNLIDFVDDISEVVGNNN